MLFDFAILTPYFVYCPDMWLICTKCSGLETISSYDISVPARGQIYTSLCTASYNKYWIRN